MFDNTKPNVILLADKTDPHSQYKTLGPYKVAQALRDAGFEVAVINHVSVFTIHEIKLILQRLISDHTLFVGVNNFFYKDISKPNWDQINFFTLTEPGMFLPHGKKYNADLKNCIKNINKNCVMVLGGPTATNSQINKDFDYILLGFAENSVVNLAQYLLDKNKPLEKSYKSIWGFTVVNDAKAENYDFPNSKLRYEDYDFVLPGETLTLEVARGCIFKCAFCAYPLNGKKKFDYIKNKQNLKDELVDNYVRLGVKRYLFADDTVNDSVEKCKMIYEISQELPFELEWGGFLRLDLMTAHPVTIDYLFGSGLKAAFFGIETLNERTAKIIGKGGDRQKLIETIKKIKSRYGDSVKVHGSFMFGLPDESLESMYETKKFLLSKDNPLDSFSVAPLFLQITTNGEQIILFTSDIEKNYTKYGYTIDNEHQSLALGRYKTIWKNQHTDYFTVEKIAEDIINQSYNQMPDTWQLFEFAGLGFSLQDFQNFSRGHIIEKFNLNECKLRRAVEYRNKVISGYNIDSEILDPDTVCKIFKTFTKYTIFRNRLDRTNGRRLLKPMPG